MIRKKCWFLLGIIKQLLHDDVPDSPLGIRVGEAALTLNDAAAAPVRDELLDVKLICEVGFVVVTEPAVSDLPLGVGIHDVTLVVKKEMYFIFLQVTRTVNTWGQHFLERDELFIQTSTSVLVKQEFPGLGGCEATLEDQDVVAFQHNLVREEFSCFKIVRVVGYIVVNEPAVFDLPLGVRSHDATLMVQDEVVHLDSDSDEMPR